MPQLIGRVRVDGRTSFLMSKLIKAKSSKKSLRIWSFQKNRIMSNNGKNLFLSSIIRICRSLSAKIINLTKIHILGNAYKIQVRTIKMPTKTRMPSIL